MNGLFITFEGIEGCGKSTQAKLLAKSVQGAGYDILLTREPGGPPISEKIREILLDKANGEMHKFTEIFLYLASRNQHTVEWIKPALKSNKIVICDRYYDSTYAYQGSARSISEEIVKKINDLAIAKTKPDITFLLDTPVKIGLERIDKLSQEIDRLESESWAFHQRVRNSYLELARKNRDRIVVLDGQEKIQSIQDKIKDILNRRFQLKL